MPEVCTTEHTVKNLFSEPIFLTYINTSIVSGEFWPLIHPFNREDLKIKGPFIKFYFKDDKTLILVGNNRQDASVLGESKWDEKAFKVGVQNVTIIAGDNLDNKATTRLQRDK